MDAVASAVLCGLAAVTGALTYYLRCHLPHMIEERTRDSFRAFSRAVELRFPNHEGLTSRVIPLSLAVGRRLGLPARRLRNLELAAQLRDIGLCSVPYKLINGKSFVRWTEGDKEAYFKHVETSARMLEQIRSLRHLAPIVRHHHANLDDDENRPGHRSFKLSLESRILKAVGDYVWSERWQGEMLARTYLEQGSGSVYDPAVLAALSDVLTSSRVAEPAAELVPAPY